MDDPEAKDVVIFALKTRHAREIERATSLLRSLVRHIELTAGTAAPLTTSHQLAVAALAALEEAK